MKTSLIAMTALAAATIAAPVHAEDFYQGKTINLIVGIAPGSGYDLNARTLARYMVNHIPGHPTIVVQNQPGAGSVTLVNKLYNAGPFDGLTFGAGFGGMPTAPLLAPTGTRFDALKLNWLGSTNQEIHVSYVWQTAPVQSFQDLLTKQLIVGAQAPGTTQYDFPVIANAIFGTKYKVISGYEGTPQIHTAMERGEIQGVGATAYTTLVALNQAWLTEGKVKVILQWGPKKAPGLENVPSAIDFAKTDADKELIKLAQARLVFGRPFFMPPKVPADRVDIMRKAFDDTVKDPEFLAEEKKLKLDVDPLSGAQVAKILADAYATPPDVVARLKGIMAGSGQ
jgi:tripartite-type tricarboxylate transporter receptor subunit TctC